MAEGALGMKQSMSDFAVAAERAALHMRIGAWFAVPQIARPPTMWALLDAAVTFALAAEQPE
jgi:hypothetical protein